MRMENHKGYENVVPDAMHTIKDVCQQGPREDRSIWEDSKDEKYGGGGKKEAGNIQGRWAIRLDKRRNGTGRGALHVYPLFSQWDRLQRKRDKKYACFKKYTRLTRVFDA